MKTKKKKITSIKEFFIRYIFLSLGVFIVAFSLECFLLPNNIIDGGVIGIAMMLNKITGNNLGFLFFIINVPFILLALKKFGLSFIGQMFYSVALLGFVTNMFHNTHATADLLLATVFGGIILGIGVGLVLRNDASLDGTEILSIVLSKKLGWVSVGELLMFFNLFIYGACGFLFGWDKAMYSIITYYITSKVIDVVLEGLNKAKSVRIISDSFDEIGSSIMKEFGVSVSYMRIMGGFSGQDKMLTYCVISRLEMAKLKQLVKEIDQSAFVVIGDVYEVDGVRVKKK